VAKGKVVENKRKNLAASLYNSKKPELSRSIKLHRSRGYLCGLGICPNCMMRVNDIGNVRICQYRADGQCTVEEQNVFPIVDSLNIINRLHKRISAGFQYRILYSSKWKRRIFYSSLKRASGLGIATSSNPIPKSKRIESAPDVLVVGGGVAGLSAALEAAKNFEKILVVDSFPDLGGEFRYRWGGSKIPEVQDALRQHSEIIASARASPRISFLTGATIIGYYRLEDLFVAIADGELHEIRTHKVAVATGAHEVLPVFENNDSPRIMLSGGAQFLFGSMDKASGRALVVDVNGTGPLISAYLKEKGTDVRGVTRTGTFDNNEQNLCSRNGVRPLPKTYVTKVTNRGHVELEANGSLESMTVDFVVVCGRYQPNYELAVQIGCGITYQSRERTWTVDGITPKVPLEASVVGAVSGLNSFEECLKSGRELTKAPRNIIVDITPDEYLTQAYSQDNLSSFVCLCEDVSISEVKKGIQEGYNGIESLKRYTGAVTGPCQGKQCALTVASILSIVDEKSSKPLFTTVRQPIQPVAFGQLVTE